jgi:hypothetical protein
MQNLNFTTFSRQMMELTHYLLLFENAEAVTHTIEAACEDESVLRSLVRIVCQCKCARLSEDGARAT